MAEAQEKLAIHGGKPAKTVPYTKGVRFGKAEEEAAVAVIRSQKLWYKQGGTRVAAVSPIVGGRALRGPADRMLATLGEEVSALGVARRYVGLVDAFVMDRADAALAPDVERLGMRAIVTRSVMTDDASRAALARVVLDACLS